MTVPDMPPLPPPTNGSGRWKEREFWALAIVAALYVVTLYKGENSEHAEALHQLLMVALPGFMVARGLDKMGKPK